MANHRASISTPCYARANAEIELYDTTISKGEIVRVERFDCVNNVYVCRQQPHGGEFAATEDQITPVKTKRFAVDVHFDLAHSIEVNARNAKEAERIIEERIRNDEINCFYNGFQQTDDYEVRCSGKENKYGEIEYF